LQPSLSTSSQPPLLFLHEMHHMLSATASSPITNSSNVIQYAFLFIVNINIFAVCIKNPFTLGKSQFITYTQQEVFCSPKMSSDGKIFLKMCLKHQQPQKQINNYQVLTKLYGKACICMPTEFIALLWILTFYKLLIFFLF